MTEETVSIRLTETDARSRSNTRRIEDLEKKVELLGRLTTAMEVMASEQKHLSVVISEVKKTVSSLDTKVETLEQKPSRRWESVTEKLLLAAVSAAAAFFLGRLGL